MAVLMSQGVLILAHASFRSRILFLSLMLFSFTASFFISRFIGVSNLGFQIYQYISPKLSPEMEVFFNSGEESNLEVIIDLVIITLISLILYVVLKKIIQKTYKKTKRL